MKAAVWHHPVHGPAVVAALPKKKDAYPDTACIPYRLPPGVLAQLGAKGEQPTWEQWARHLAEGLPQHGRWTVEDVPDGLDAHAALAHVREKALSRGLDPGQATL